MLQQTTKQIQQINNILKRLIPEDDKHLIIESQTEIEIFPEQLVTFKIPCLKKSAPLKVYFRYTKSNAVQDLMVYVSNDEAIPTEKRNDLKVSKPACITVNE